MSATEIRTPTPRATVVSPSSASTPAPASQTTSQQQTDSESNDRYDFEYKGTVRIAQWPDSRVEMVSFLTGYILVQGMVYKAEVVEMETGEHQQAIESDEVDVVMEVDRVEEADWYGKVTEAGTVIDAGSLYGPDSNIRIMVRSQVKDTLPEVFTMLEKASAGDGILEGLASRISGGRVGLSPTAAAITFLKQNDEVWSGWVEEYAVAGVNEALAENKNNLFRACARAHEGGSMVNCK